MGGMNFGPLQKLRFPTIINIPAFWTRGKNLPNRPERSIVISADIFEVLLPYFRVLVIVKLTIRSTENCGYDRSGLIDNGFTTVLLLVLRSTAYWSRSYNWQE